MVEVRCSPIRDQHRPRLPAELRQGQAPAEVPIASPATRKAKYLPSEQPQQHAVWTLHLGGQPVARENEIGQRVGVASEHVAEAADRRLKRLQLIS